MDLPSHKGAMAYLKVNDSLCVLSRINRRTLKSISRAFQGLSLNRFEKEKEIDFLPQNFPLDEKGLKTREQGTSR